MSNFFKAMPNTSNVILDGTEISRVKTNQTTTTTKTKQNKARRKTITTKFIGLTIDENLTWKHHIDNITRTI